MCNRTAMPKEAGIRAGTHRARSTYPQSGLHETGLSEGVPAADLDRFENVIFARRLVRTGECLFVAGDTFGSIYSIHSGFFKTSLADGDGREQVTGFFMPGELLGIDGLGNGRYHACASALEDSCVCVMPYALVESMAREVPALQRRLHSALAQEIARSQGIMMLLGSMNGQERLAAFLLNLSSRFRRRGYSGSDLRLRMTRGEIGSYLGLSLETVSRLFSTFQRIGLLEVQQKNVAILDLQGLGRVLGGKGAAYPDSASGWRPPAPVLAAGAV